jgi:thioesterase domain-containing protein
MSFSEVINRGGLNPPDLVERESVVLIREGGSDPPLFLVHDCDGGTLPYLNLACHLHGNRSIYGLLPKSRQNTPILHTRTTDMAAYHCAKIRSIQPQGPYMLGGFCVGGVVAFEIALQLQKQGQKVGMVALMEVPGPRAKRSRRESGRSIGLRSLQLRKEVPTASRQETLLDEKSCFEAAKRIPESPVESPFEKVKDEIKLRLMRYYLDRHIPLDRLLQGIPVRTVCRFAERDYRPSEHFEGSLSLFRASAGDTSDEPFGRGYKDPLLGWAAHATAGVRAYDVPGGHFSMLQEPHVRVLAECMQGCLDGVQRSAMSAKERLGSVVPSRNDENGPRIAM